MLRQLAWTAIACLRRDGFANPEPLPPLGRYVVSQASLSLRDSGWRMLLYGYGRLLFPAKRGRRLRPPKLLE